MNSAVVNVKVDPEVKRGAQRIAHELGLSLSAYINASLRQLIRKKAISFEAREEPSEYMIKALKESQEDIKAGRVSPTFTRAKDAIKWLNDPKKKYVYQIRKRVRKTI